MRNLIFILILSISMSSLAKHKTISEQVKCKKLDFAAKMLNVKKFLSETMPVKFKSRSKKKSKKSKSDEDNIPANTSEVEVELSTIEEARKYVTRFPAFEELGFGSFSPSTWKKYVGNFKRSKGFGKVVGWKKKLKNGSSALFRIDYDDKKGLHYNIVIELKNKDLHTTETHKLAVEFDCPKKVCTEKDFEKILEKLN